MSPSVLGWVLLAALCHATWNAYVKASDDRLAGLVSINLIGAVSGLLMMPFVSSPDAAGWMLLAVSVPVHILYKFLLAVAYGRGELTQIYPVVRGVAPLTVWVIALVLLGERMTFAEVVGMVLICAGIFVLAMEHGRLVQTSWRLVLIAILTGMTIAVYTTIDGLGARHGATPFSFAAWLFFLDGALFTAAVHYWRGPKLWTTMRLSWPIGLISGLVAVGSYGVFIWALSLGAMGTVAALRETSVLFAALIGVLVLRERLGQLRVVAAACITLGIVLIVHAR
jgi:drug/metabolite transporter (DMT)-like permease